MKDIGICRLDEVTMKDIEKLETSVFSKREKYMHLISCDRFEIENRIRETLKGEILREYTPLAKIFNTQCDEEYFKSIRFTRNFLAHSGLEKCVTEIKIENEVIKMRYNEKYREYIIRAALEGLKIVE